MGGASLQLSAGEHLADDIHQTLETIGAHEAYTADTAPVQVLQHLAPAQGSLRGLVEDSNHFPGLVLPYRQNDIERFRIHAAPAVDLDVDAVDEHHRGIALQRPLQPLRHIPAEVLQQPRYARLAVVLTVDVVENLPRLAPESGLWCTMCLQDARILSPDHAGWPVCGWKFP